MKYSDMLLQLGGFMKKRSIIFIFILFMIGLTYIVGLSSPTLIETYYSLGFNKWFLQFLSHCTGFIPLSLFEIGIYSLLLCLAYRLLVWLYIAFKRTTPFKRHLTKGLLHIFYFGLTLIFLFYWEWGFNYNRVPLRDTLSFTRTTFTTEELGRLYETLIEKANTLRPFVNEDENGYMTIPGGYKSVFARADLGYLELAKLYPIFYGSYGKPKPILASTYMNYTGITGIYSPFTGEANVNVAILPQALPYTTLHEMAHQRGFASEDECNFIAFLACSVHPDVDFEYSGYLLALAYTNNALSSANPELLKQLNTKLSDKVKADIHYNNTFWKHYSGPIEKASSKVNDTYLKANGISDGERSYGRMVDLLLSYYHDTLDVTP